MFEKFCLEFGAIPNTIEVKINDYYKELLHSSKGALEFMMHFEGRTFKDGLYRIHKVSELDKWNQIIYRAFPTYRNKIFCFSYDWLGRHFALDFTRINDGEPMILMLEPGTGEALEIPASFITFHEEEIIIYTDAALAADFYYEWKRENNRPLDINKCVGYKIPLYLGGEDNIDNLEVSDMEVYWGITEQLISE